MFDDINTANTNFQNTINGQVNTLTTSLTELATVTPEKFGAIGNGVNNDQAALQNAINYLNGIGGGKLKLKTGATYLLGTAQLVLLQLYSNITIQGNATFKIANNLGNYDRIFDLTTVKNVALKDFTINSNNTNNKRTNATTTNNNRTEIYSWYGTCDNVLIDHISILDTVGTWQITINGRNCHLINSFITYATDNTGFITYDRTSVYWAVIGGTIKNNILVGSNVSFTALEYHGDQIEISHNAVSGGYQNPLYIVNDSTIVSTVNTINIHHNYFNTSKEVYIYFALNANVGVLSFNYNTCISPNGISLFQAEVGNFTCDLVEIVGNDFTVTQTGVMFYSFKTTGTAIFKSIKVSNNKFNWSSQTGTGNSTDGYAIVLGSEAASSVFQINNFYFENNELSGSIYGILRPYRNIDGFTDIILQNNNFINTTISYGLMVFGNSNAMTGTILFRKNHYNNKTFSSLFLNGATTTNSLLFDELLNINFQTALLNTTANKTTFLNFVKNGSIIRNNNGDTIEVVNSAIRANVYTSAVPSSGAWTQGDNCKNTAPAASGYMGWVCVTTGDFAGTVPVFKGYGLIQA
jgi:hypothetical protein